MSKTSLIYICYHAEGELHFEEHRLTSLAEVQQEDSLGPLLISLVIMELTDKFDCCGNIPIRLWYLDDRTFIGFRKDVAYLSEHEITASHRPMADQTMPLTDH